jgi:hypothetical protein
LQCGVRGVDACLRDLTTSETQTLRNGRFWLERCPNGSAG